MKNAFAALVLLVLCVPPLNAGQDLAEAVAMDYDESLSELFVWFHSHPELSFREYETAARLAQELRSAGVEVTEGTPPTVNDDELAARIHAAFVRDLGEDAVYEKKREGMGAEDFAFFVMTDDEVPGAYFSVGGTSQADLDADEAGGPRCRRITHHSSRSSRNRR